MSTLLAEWGFLDNLSDTSGNGHTGTPNWTPTYVTGPQTNTRAVHFSANTQSIDWGRTGLEPAQAAGGIVSMAWVRANITHDGYFGLINKMRAFDSTRHTLSLHVANIFYMSRWRGRLQFADTSAVLAGNGWHHVCNIDADDRWAILVDGVQVAGAADVQSSALAAWEAMSWTSGFDANSTGFANTVNMDLSGVRLFSGTMTNAEVVTWMNTAITSGTPTRTGKPKVWDGSAWVAHPAKTWNGTAWGAHAAKGYNGTIWTPSK